MYDFHEERELWTHIVNNEQRSTSLRMGLPKLTFFLSSRISPTPNIWELLTCTFDPAHTYPAGRASSVSLPAEWFESIGLLFFYCLLKSSSLPYQFISPILCLPVQPIFSSNISTNISDVITNLSMLSRKASWQSRMRRISWENVTWAMSFTRQVS